MEISNKNVFLFEIKNEQQKEQVVDSFLFLFLTAISVGNEKKKRYFSSNKEKKRCSSSVQAGNCWAAIHPCQKILKKRRWRKKAKLNFHMPCFFSRFFFREKHILPKAFLWCLKSFCLQNKFTFDLNFLVVNFPMFLAKWIYFISNLSKTWEYLRPVFSTKKKS